MLFSTANPRSLFQVTYICSKVLQANGNDEALSPHSSSDVPPAHAGEQQFSWL